MRKIPLLICLAIVGMLELRAQTLTVWPGDANNTQRCNHVDLLYIGQNFGVMGPPRNTTNTAWLPFNVQSWPSGPVQLNAAYSDCDGDGEVNRNDAIAIEQNFGQSNGGFFLPDDTSSATVGSPPLQVVISTDSVFVSGQVTLSLDVNLGSQGAPVDSIYGLAITLTYDPMIVDQVILTGWTGGFIADSAGNNIVFSRVDSVAGKIYLAITGTDHINRMGYGTLGTIGIVMDDNIRIASEYDLVMGPTYVLGLTQGGEVTGIEPIGDVVHISTGVVAPELAAIKVYPNPASRLATVSSPQTAIERIAIRDISGRTVAALDGAYSFETSIEIDRLPAGCYLLEVYTASGVLRRKLVVQSY